MTTTTTRRVLAGITAAAAAIPVVLLTAGPSAAATVSDQTAETLQYMVAEEKLARDVYTVLGDRYDVRVFDTIARAESRHMAAVRTLLAGYGVTDPTAGDAAGHFDDARLQSLYDDLVRQGLTSITSAAEVGITIERTDIADLDAAIATTDAADISRVLQSLRRGSQHHLAAFTALKADPTATHVPMGNGPQNGRPGQGQGMQGAGQGAQNGAGTDCPRR